MKRTIDGVPATTMLGVAGVLRDALHPGIETCRGEIERYLRRVAAPAVARFVVYQYNSRVTHFEGQRHDGDSVTDWYEHRNDGDGPLHWFLNNDIYEIIGDVGRNGTRSRFLDYPELAERIARIPEGLSGTDRDEAIHSACVSVVESSEGWLRFCLRKKSECPGFAGYAMSEDCDWAFIEALPDRVLEALSKKPPQITLDFCAFLRCAHGASAVDDIEPDLDVRPHNAVVNGVNHFASMALNLVNTYPNNRYNGAQVWATFTGTIAYLPSFESGKPISITSVPYSYDHGAFRNEKHRRNTGLEICAMGPSGASLRRLFEA